MNRPRNAEKGLVPIVIVIIVVVLLGVGGAGWYIYSKNQVTPSAIPLETSSPSATPSPTPTKTATPSAKLTPKPTAVASAKPTAKPTASPSPSSSPTQAPTGGCNTSTDLGNLTVKIEPESGQSLVGDAAVTMKNGSGNCAGTDSRLPYTQVISQGSTSITFPSFRPGKYSIEVSYHGKTSGTDATVNPGDNTTTVTVSN